MSAERDIDPGKQWRGAHGIPVVPVFDGYRAAAIGCVVLFHVFQVSGVFAALGDSTLGVLSWGILPRSLDVLFIVSGFVIYLPTAARAGDFGRVTSFAIRRAARLFPAYWVAIAIALALIAVVGTAGGFPGLDDIGLHLGVLQTPMLLFEDGFALGFGVIPPVWTLSVEIGFYLVLPFVAGAYFKRPIAGLIVAGAVVALWHLAGENADEVAGFFGAELSSAAEGRIATYYASQFPAWIFALACGMTGAWAFVRLRETVDSRLLKRRAGLVTGVAAVALAGLVWIAGQEAVSDPDPLTGLFARQSLFVALAYPATLIVVLVGLALAPAGLQRPFSNSPMRWTGDISYAIFLIHFAFIWFALEELSLSQDGSFGALAAWCALTFPLSLGYAYLSAVFVERPVRRWAQRYGRRGEAPPGEAARPAPSAP